MSESTPQQPWDARLRAAATKVEAAATNAATNVEEDLRRLINYVNDEVVPEVRRNGSSALRTAATELQQLAQRMEDHNRKP